MCGYISYDFWGANKHKTQMQKLGSISVKLKSAKMYF